MRLAPPLAVAAAALAVVTPASTPARAVPDAVLAAPVTGRVLTVVDEEAGRTSQAVVGDDEVVRVPAGVGPLPAGATVAVSATGSVRVLAAARRQPRRLARGGAPAPQEVYVARVAPAGTALDRLPSEAATVSLVTQAGRYWSGQTGGRLTFTVAGRLAAYTSAYGCDDDPFELWQEARERFLAATGVDVLAGAGRHLLLALPPTAYAAGCAAGLATIGTALDEGGVLYASQHQVPVYAHELGHNVGLSHAGSLLCATRRDSGLGDGGAPTAGRCHREAYDDYLEVMSSYGGSRGTGNLNGPHLDDLGLEPGLVRPVAVGTSAVLRLAPLADRTGAVRAAKAPDGSRQAYFVQYRTAAGLDRGAPASYRLGVEVHREDPAAYGLGGSLLLDMTPSGRAYDLDRVLRPGATFTAASGRVAVTVLRQDPAGATVRVTNGVRPGGVPARLAVAVTRSGGVRVTGVLRDTAGRFVPGTPLKVQRRDRTGAPWRTVRRGSTDPHGRVAVTVTAGRSAYLRLVVPASATRGAVRSAAQPVT